MANSSETGNSPTPEWEHEGIEASYRELQAAELVAATKIQGHLMELGTGLANKAPIRVEHEIGKMDRWDVVFNPEDGTLAVERWKTAIWAPDVPSYDRNTYSDNLEIEIVEPQFEKSIPLTLENGTAIWLQTGKKLATAIHNQVASQSTQ